MNALDQLNTYLRRVEARLRLLAISRGAALTTIAALALTVVLVWIVNRFGFSDASVLSARFVLFLAVAAAIGFGLVIPLLRMNRRHAARTAEARFPEFEQRLLTMAEKSHQADPFVHLLAADTMEVAKTSEPERLAPRLRIFGFITSASAAVFILLWLIFAGPGIIGYGTGLLWAGAPKAGARPVYDIIVSPGNRSVRRKSDQLVTARLVGFDTRNVHLYAQYQGASKWEQVNMTPQPQGSGYEFLFGGLSNNVEYFVEAGAVQSKHYSLKVVDLPGVKKVRVTYHYPKWSGLKDATEDPGGDLRAVEGTEAEVAIETDKTLPKGLLMLNDDSQIELNHGEGNWLTARVPIKKDGMYHIAAIDNGENVRLSDDYFIEARKDNPPTVKISRPGRDAKVSPIEEVTVVVDGDDDFGLQEMALHYSVNGGPEKSVPILKQSGAKTGSGTHVIPLEDYKMQPGDLVSMYATARDATHSVKTDMYFLEAQPYERDYTQSQQMGGGGGGGGQQDDEVSQRQKDIIAATWNEIKTPKSANDAREDAKFLSDMQRKLSAQAHSLAERMKSRQLAGAGNEFQTFVTEMDQASAAMNDAADKIQTGKWQEALNPQQKALQHVLRSEALFRDIQVAFGQRGGGGGGGGAGRDLENMFDLELDTEKNQYETGQQSASSGDSRQEEIDKALEKLKELAKRQQELAQQQRNQQQNFQQRWEQEMLRREAEELKRQMEQLQRGDSGQQSSQSQQGQQSQSGQQGQQGQSSSSSSSQSGQQGQQGQMSRSQQQQQQQQQRQLARRQQPIADPRLQEAIKHLEQAEDDMRQAASAQQNGNQDQGAAGQRRAADKLRQAQDLLNGMNQQQSGQSMDDMVKQAEQLASHQQDFVNRLRQSFGAQDGNTNPYARQQPTAQTENLAKEKEKMAEDLKRLEHQMQSTASQTRDSQPGVSSKLRDALGEAQQNELDLRMRKTAEMLRQGQGPRAWLGDTYVTQGVEKLRDQLKETQALAQGKGAAPGAKDPNKNSAERALAAVEDARNRLEQMAARAGQQRGNQPGQQGQQPGQQGQPGQQPGQQAGQQGQQGQQPGQQPGGQQPGQQGQQGQQSGQQEGGQQQGGQSGQASGDRGAAYGPRGGYGPSYGDDMGGYRGALRDLSQVRQDVRQTDAEYARELDQIMRDLQRLYNGPQDASKMDATISRELLPALERLELELKSKVDQQKGQVRSAGTEPVPQGYADSVAEYFRRLSKGK